MGRGRSRKGIVQLPKHKAKYLQAEAEEAFGRKIPCPHGCNPATVKFSSEFYLEQHERIFHTPRLGEGR